MDWIMEKIRAWIDGIRDGLLLKVVSFRFIKGYIVSFLGLFIDALNAGADVIPADGEASTMAIRALFGAAVFALDKLMRWTKDKK